MTISQPTAALLRHILLFIVSAFGIITQSVTALHLPLAVSSVMTAAYPVLLFIEHFVADPSTGTPTPPAPPAPPVPPAA
jgi:hypothetical protein